jgi:hypothetical protein
MGIPLTDFVIVTNIGMTAVLPRHQGKPGRGANGSGCVVLREAHPLGSKTVEVRRFDFLLTVAPEFRPAEVISHDVDDIRFIGVRENRASQSEQETS